MSETPDDPTYVQTTFVLTGVEALRYCRVREDGSLDVTETANPGDMVIITVYPSGTVSISTPKAEVTP